MAEPQDKLLGVRISGKTTTRVYSAYRIDYDDSRDLSEIAGVDDLQSHYTGATKYIGTTAINRGYYTVKSGYQRKVLVADATTRDEVQSDLDAEGVSYTTEDVTPTQAERQAIEQYGVENSQEVQNAFRWDRSVIALDAGHITQSQYQRWNAEEVDVEPAPSIGFDDGSIVNDGADTETITISHSFDVEREAVLIVDDSSFAATLTPGSDYTETVTTTKTAGNPITVSIVGNFLGPQPREIEVTN